MWLFSFLTMIGSTFIFAIYFPQELFQRAVKAGHDPDLVKEILEEDWDLIRDRLGGPVADDILGEPGILERYG